jgi:hypothetical protein
VPVPAVQVYTLYPDTVDVSTDQDIPAEKVAEKELGIRIITTPDPPFPPLGLGPY